ncbi:CobW family GTP-binding protein [Psychrobacter pygoscelis]|uniref:CobW family GTP-binding protein n=1 Tax=Psychrobacter pygoscelis TaxID=2488563 RepID=UPI0010400664|nr:GTP-binding protein [Psychrobacter pygoscelis]
MFAKHIIKNTPCTLLTGFLGSGKTTLINQLLAFKTANEVMADERWALLINEFGQIGIDAQLIDRADEQLAIREVSGGCICCTSQLPLQIALTRLLAEQQPQRLIIEPTGLAHPKSLLQQLSEPHWQTSLSLHAIIGVVSARQWQQPKYRHHDGYQAHVLHADYVVINRYEMLNETEKEQLSDWIIDLNPTATLIWLANGQVENAPKTVAAKAINSGTIAAKDLDNKPTCNPPSWYEILQSPSQALSKFKQKRSTETRIALNMSGLSPANTVSIAQNADTHNSAQIVAPYRYHDRQQGMSVGGWKLPQQWQFAADELQTWLLSLPNWQRIKGVVNTTEGWLRLNFTPDSLKTIATEPQADSLLEVILLDNMDDAQDATINKQQYSDEQWQDWDRQLIERLASK